MAKLSPEVKILISNLKKQLLEILDDSRKAEFLLLGRFGETHETVIALDELTEIAQQARDLYSQLSRLRVQVAEAQPTLSPDVLRFLTERITIVQNRIPALERSIEEIKLDWDL